MCSNINANFEELQLGKDDLFEPYGDTLGQTIPNIDIGNHISMKQETDNITETSQFSMADDIASFNDQFFNSNFSFDTFADDFPLNVLEEATKNLDSGSESELSPDHYTDLQFPFGLPSPVETDVSSEVSSTSDLGSLGSTGDCSPERLNTQELLDFSPSHSLPKNNQIVATHQDIFCSASNMLTAGPQKTHIKLETIQSKAPTNLKSFSVKTLAQPTITPSSNGSTIVLTQGSKTGQVLRSGTLIKTINKGNAVYYPLQVVKDLGQGKTFKVISTTNPNLNNQGKNAIRTVTFRTNTSSGPAARTILNKTMDGRPILKVGPSLLGKMPQKYVTPSVTVKEEPIICDDDDEECPQNGQELTLTEEEKRLLKKEQISLPTHYPLSKQEERDLKRIRRKIRNKISAQDSRKRKKEYVDGLETKIDNADLENKKLQKRIRHLENQNDHLTAHLKRYQQIVDSGSSTGRNVHHGQASTALMMLVISAALFVVPNLKPQDIRDNELSNSADALAPGQTRSLLEAAAVAINKKELPTEQIQDWNPEDKDFNPLSEHDYAPPAKRPRIMSPATTPFTDLIPRLDKKSLMGQSGEPPDRVSTLVGAVLDTFSRSWNESKRDSQSRLTLDRATQSVVLNLNSHGKLRDDIEVE